MDIFIEIISRILNLPEFRLFIDFWYIWIPLVFILIAIDIIVTNKSRHSS